MVIEFFFDCSSPWTYLAFRNLQPLAAGLGLPIAWRPILVGGIFNQVNPSMYLARENPDSPKSRYMRKDLADCARETGLSLVFPPTVFPVNSVKAMRACLWLAQDAHGQDRLVPFIEAVFNAYFVRDQDISQDAVLEAIARGLALDADALLRGMALPETKAQLKANTDEAIRRGVFGAPTFFLGDDMYFGNDRLPLLGAAVARASQSL